MKNRTIAAAILSLMVPFSSFSEENEYKPAYTPWYTGVLQASSSGNASPGQLFLQPYYNALFRYGDFNASWKMVPLKEKQVILSPQLLVQFGITNRLDFTIMPTMITSMQGGMSQTLFTDLYTSFGIQILRDIPNTWVPNLRFVFSVFFPTGKYDMGELSRLATDFGGIGAYEIGGVFAIGKTFYYFPEHPFRLLFNLGITGYTDADVRGLSVYGGIPETIGTVHPGGKFYLYFCGEWSLTQRWVLAFETYFGYLGENRFVGEGFGIPFQFDEKMRLQFIPEIEYNWSDTLGVVGGVQYQFAGYNQSAYTNIILSLVYCY